MLRSLLATLLLATFSVPSLALTYHAADISSVPIVERQGVKYTDNGQQAPFETILKNHGLNTARIRVWTAGDYNLTYALSFAKRVKAAGLTLVVDLHFSDTWADPGHQSTPAGWPNTLSGLNTQVYTYTQSLVKSFSNQGTPIDILQVGNEINSGMLWPTGEISVNGYNGLSQLLNSAISGARSSGSPKIMIHLANGWDWSGLQSWFKGTLIQGAFSLSDFDILGVSFYPFYGTGATLSALKSSLTNAINTYGKDVVVAEADWPVTCSGVSLSEPSVPVSAAGQATWISDITSVLAALPGGHGKGIFYWEPGWIGNAALGSGCSDNLIVNSNGSTRSSINIFQNM